MTLRQRAIAWLACACIVAAVLTTPARSAEETIALVGATVQTMGPAGELKNAVVVMREGRILAVGANARIPPGARTIDVAGKVVTPGLVATVTPLSLADAPDRPGADDSRTSNKQVSAAFDVRYSVNPESTLIAEARTEGVTDAIVTPAPGMRSGEDSMPFFGAAAAIHLGEATDLLLRANVAILLSAGEQGAVMAGGGRGAQMALLGDLIAKVRLFARSPAAFDTNRVRPLNMSRADLQALVPVIEGKVPLLVSVRRASDILNVLELAKRERLRLILADVDEGWLVAREIAAAGVPAVIDPEMSVPNSFEARNVVEDNAARLIHAGVLVAYQPAIARLYYRVRTPRFLAGRTVSRGVPYHAALEAITINPARIFGLEKLFGSIEVGKRADIVVWSGDPMETATATERVFVGGVEQPIKTRPMALRDKYIHTVLPR